MTDETKYKHLDWEQRTISDKEGKPHKLMAVYSAAIDSDSDVPLSEETPELRTELESSHAVMASFYDAPTGIGVIVRMSRLEEGKEGGNDAEKYPVNLEIVVRIVPPNGKEAQKFIVYAGSLIKFAGLVYAHHQTQQVMAMVEAGVPLEMVSQLTGVPLEMLVEDSNEKKIPPNLSELTGKNLLGDLDN